MVSAFQRFPIWKLYCYTFQLMTCVVYKSLLSLRSSFIFGVLYKFSEVMFIRYFRPVFLTCCKGPIRYTKSLLLGNMSKNTIYFMWICSMTSVFYWLPYRVASYLYTMNHARSIQLLVIRHLFQITYRK